MSNQLNEWILSQLKERGWSIRELARRGGLSQGHISRVLSGENEPGAKFYVGMSKAFDLPLHAIELLDKSGDLPELEDDKNLSLKEWVVILEELNPDQRAALLKYAFHLLRGLDVDTTGTGTGAAKPVPKPTG